MFDEVTRAHPFLSQHWSQFVRSIRLVQHNPSQFELHAHQAGARLQQLNAEIARLDAELMGGDIFKVRKSGWFQKIWYLLFILFAPLLFFQKKIIFQLTELKKPELGPFFSTFSLFFLERIWTSTPLGYVIIHSATVELWKEFPPQNAIFSSRI